MDLSVVGELISEGWGLVDVRLALKRHVGAFDMREAREYRLLVCEELQR